MKFFGLAGMLLAGLMSVTGGAYAQNIITALTVGYNSSATVIKIDLVRPPSKLPDTEFIAAPSPHIVLEFSDTASGLDEPVHEFTEGGLRSANIIQSGERTRLVLYLNQMYPYNIRTDGSSLLIALQGNAGNAEGLALRPAETKQDAQRRILISEAKARLKAEQETRAAEEEKARQAAEAEAAKIKAKEEAKAEALRVKAEQKAKAEAAALARKAAKAEAARLAAEQKAKIKAEKEAAALSKQTAKAEAARLVAEQKAKVKAEKEAAALARQAAEAEAARLAAEKKAEAEKRAAEAEVARLRAEWIMVGENKILGLTAYADPDTETVPKNAKKNGDKLKMWKIYDYKTTREASGYKFISAKFQDEYDCKEEKIRLLVNTAFSGNMGVGEAVFTSTDAGKWQPVRPGSIDEAMWKFACRNK
ncbi:MAG: hypothetical protein HY936_06725 [Nitrosomonadales bacterium]|nr:hypothetical protein [Nitrosomonadales bacterium]